MAKNDNSATFALDKAQVRATFERAAQSYDAVAVLQREVADRMIERLELVKFRPETILDAGCGTGYGARALARRYPHARIVGLDIAAAMAARAREKSGWWNRLARRRQRFVCGDAERLPLADGSVDMVVSNLTLQWCRPEQTFAEFRRVLRPGGLLMFTTFGPDTLKELRAAWGAADASVHVHAFLDMHDLGDMLVRALLADPVMDVERLTLTYKDALEVLRDLKQLGAHNVAQARARGLTGKERFARFKVAYEALAIDGRIPATYEVVYGHAWAPLKRGEGRGTRGEGWKAVSVAKRISSPAQGIKEG